MHALLRVFHSGFSRAPDETAGGFRLSSGLGPPRARHTTRKNTMKSLTLAVPIGATALALASGCASTKHLTASEPLYYAGQYQQAEETVRAVLDEEEDPASLEKPGYILDNLYAGSAAFMGGETETAAEDFRRAGEGIAAQEAATIPIGYPTRAYDATMAAQYRALALWMQGDADATRVAFRLVADAQDKAEERNARAIRREQDAAEKQRAEAESEVAAKAGPSSSGSGELGQVSSAVLSDPQLQAFQGDFDTWGVYGNYQVPSSWLLDAVFALANAEDASDLEHSSFSARKSLAMAPTKAASLILKIAEARADGKLAREQLDKLLVVIFENGLGPTIEERRFDIPFPFDGAIYNVSFALPNLVRRNPAYSKLIVRDGAVALGETESIADIDRVAVREFKGRLPGIIASQVLEAAVKLAVQIVVVKAAEKQGGSQAKFFASLAMSAVSSAVTGTDTRHWNLLPKEVQMAVLKKPSSGNHTVSLWVPGGIGPIGSVDLPEKGIAVVYVKIPGAGLPPLVRLLGNPAK